MFFVVVVVVVVVVACTWEETCESVSKQVKLASACAYLPVRLARALDRPGL